MAVNKEHKEFHQLDLSVGWETLAGYPAGIQQKILSGSLNEIAKSGRRSRLLRFAPGVYTTAPFVHDYWEEVYLVSGDLTVGSDERGEGGTAHPARITDRLSPRTAACCLSYITTTRLDFALVAGGGEILSYVGFHDPRLSCGARSIAAAADKARHASSDDPADGGDVAMLDRGERGLLRTAVGCVDEHDIGSLARCEIP
jgi:hypothetical protein